MTYAPDRELHLTHDAERGYWHFVLYIEPPGACGSALNATQQFDPGPSPYAAEWLNRLQRCDPDALHVTLVGSNEAQALWHPCVYEDPDSPSAVAQDGCVCWQTFRDPVTWLPVTAHHYRTVTGNIENWQYRTYAPLSLPDGERLEALIIDREPHMFWIRSSSGRLHVMPEQTGAGYSCGYHGGGPVQLASMIDKIVASDGYDVAAEPSSRTRPSERVLAWVSSEAADRTQELTLNQLKILTRTGMVG